MLVYSLTNLHMYKYAYTGHHIVPSNQLRMTAQRTFNYGIICFKLFTRDEFKSILQIAIVDINVSYRVLVHICYYWLHFDDFTGDWRESKRIIESVEHCSIMTCLSSVPIGASLRSLFNNNWYAWNTHHPHIYIIKHHAK